MSKLHIFIDGSWLIKVCAPKGVLAKKMYKPDEFVLDFGKLKNFIFESVKEREPECTEIGDCYFVTSIFQIPDDVDTWEGRTIKSSKITEDAISKTKWNVNMREKYAARAVAAGYAQEGIITVPLKDWMIQNLTNGKYQEKQVDTTVVALFVKYAITQKDDYFAVVAGDSDILPAINIAYPEFTSRLCLVTTHPDQLDATHRQTSFSFLQHDYSVGPIYLHDCVDKIAEGANLYKCSNCNKVFASKKSISQYKLPYCPKCQKKRT